MANPDGGQSLQTRAWGEFKRRHGWEPHYLVFDKPKIAMLLLRKKASGWGDIWYSPKGPGVATSEQFDEIANQMAVSDMRGAVVKIEPEISDKPHTLQLLKSPFDIHISQATIVVDLEPSADELLASFKQKTRYNIRLAERNGVETEGSGVNPTNCETLYQLMMATQARTGFAARPAGYYFDYWQSQGDVGQGHIFIAKFKGKPMAGAFVQTLGDKAWYKDGGSTRDEANVQAPYGLHWHIMQWLKDKGLKSYDLVGVPREGDNSSPLGGLVQFKTGFNGERREFIGTYDLPLSSWQYWGWRQAGERVTLKLSRKLKNELWY